MIGIYKITSPSNRIYIGQSIDINRRFNDYIKKNNCKRQIKLYSSFEKYGRDSHNFEIIEECEIVNLNIRERFYQELYNCVEHGLNCKYVPVNGRVGYLSEETKKKIGSGNKGKIMSNESKVKLSKSCMGKIRIIGGSHPTSKLVMDTQTGIIFDCVREASTTYNIPYATLKDWLKGRYKNKSNLIYI